ncbi:Mitochondrial fission regulator 2 [Schistosoma japonicum]|nr:Mitochondrial fission regulator 2 [Schistosoma japonicum]
MSTYSLNILQHLLVCIRSYCSLRYVVKFLPIGSLAPRINIYNHVLLSKNSKQYDDCNCSMDSNMVYTSNCTDFDDDNYYEQNWNLCSNSLPDCISCCGNNKHTVSNSLSIPDSCVNFRHHQQSNIPVYYVGSFSNVHTSSPALKTNSTQNCIDNRSHKLGVKSPSKIKRNQGHRRKHMTGKRFEKYPKSKTSILNDNTSDTTDSDEQSCCHSSKSNRISQLEHELSHLRSQIAQLILAQESNKPTTSDVDRDRFPYRLDGDGESDDTVGSGLQQAKTTSYNSVPECANTSTPLVLLPPPLPPPPLMIFPPTLQGVNGGSNWRDQLREKLKCKENNSLGKTSPKKTDLLSTPQNPADMSQVLKELQSGSIKLRTVPRSPGGTPIKQKQSPTISGSDPCAIIARALRSKFSHLRSMIDNSTSEEETSCQSNVHLDSGLGPGCEDVWSPKRKTNNSPHSLVCTFFYQNYPLEENGT